MSKPPEGQEVTKHNTRRSCWVIVKGQVYDVTEYLDHHPGGSAILLRYGGKDATAIYESNHPKGTIEGGLTRDKHLGPVSMSTIRPLIAPTKASNVKDAAEIRLSHCLNLDDIERAAERVIQHGAWAYIHSAADSLGSLGNNQADWKKITLRPRIMRNVRRVNMERIMLGQKSRLPFFIAPAARARLVHEDGELCLARGAARSGIPYCPSTYSTVTHADLAKCMEEAKCQNNPFGTLFFQLYAMHERSRTIELITMARKLKFTALVITVDTPVVGKREEDERYRAELATAAGDDSILTDWINPSEDDNGPPLRGHHSSTLNWDDLPWIRETWQNSGPIVLKGIQTAEGAALAADYNIDAIYLSNHGGRQCDDAPSSIRTLLEIRRFCPHILTQMEVYLDGWVRRGADIVKALCLGATGLAIGRPFMYSVAMGDEGVMAVIRCECTTPQPLPNASP